MLVKKHVRITALTNKNFFCDCVAPSQYHYYYSTVCCYTDQQRDWSELPRLKQSRFICDIFQISR